MDYKQRLRRAMGFLREYAAIARKNLKHLLNSSGIIVIATGVFALWAFLALTLISLSFAFLGVMMLFGIGICVLALVGKALFGDDRFVDWISSKSKQMREHRERKDSERR